MSASESAFSDAEEELSQRAGPSERKRQRSVEEMFKSAEGKRKRVVSPKHSEKVSKNQRHDFLDEIKRQIHSRRRWKACLVILSKTRWTS